MKTTFKSFLLTLLISAAGLTATQAQTTYFWDGGNIGASTYTWDSTTAEWGATNGAASNVAWPAGDVADFTTNPTTVAGNNFVTVNVSGTMNVTGLSFGTTTGGYRLEGGGTLNDAAGGEFDIIPGASFGLNGDAIGAVKVTGASSYVEKGSSSIQSTSGVQLRDGVQLDNNFVLGTGTDFGEISIFQTGSVFASTVTGKTITVNNGWGVEYNSGGTFTDTIHLKSMGDGNNANGAIIFGNSGTYAGNIIVDNDSSIIMTENAGGTFTGKITGAISGSGNLYLGYNVNTSLPAAGDGLIMASTSNTSTGNTIIFNNAQPGAITGGPTAQAVRLGATNALAQTTLVLGETLGSNTTLGDGTTITTANNTFTKTGANWQSSDGALDMNGFNQRVAGLVVGGNQLGSNQYIFNNAASTTSTLTVNGNTTSPTTGFAGTIEDNAGSGGKVALSVTGGAVKLSGANKFTGGTSVTGGTLTAGVASNIANGTGAFGATTNAVTVSGGKLDLNNFSQTLGALTLNGTGNVSLGGTTGGTTDILTLSSLNWAGGASNFTLNLNSAYTTTAAIDTLSLTLSGSNHTFDIFGGTVGTTYDILNTTGLNAGDYSAAGDTGTFGTDASGDLTFEVTGFGAVPEPSTWAMLLAGMGLLIFIGRARVKSRA